MRRIRKESTILCCEGFSYKGEEKRKLRSLFLLIDVEKIMRKRKGECTNFIYPFQYMRL